MSTQAYTDTDTDTSWCITKQGVRLYYVAVLPIAITDLLHFLKHSSLSFICWHTLKKKKKKNFFVGWYVTRNFMIYYGSPITVNVMKSRKLRWAQMGRQIPTKFWCRNILESVEYFLVLTPCKYQRFRDPCWLQLHLTLKMEAVWIGLSQYLF